MLPDRVSNPGPLTYESGALPIALRGPAILIGNIPSGHTMLKQPCINVDQRYDTYIILYEK